MTGRATLSQRVQDVAADAFASLASAPGRALLTMLSTLLGLATLVVVAGLNVSSSRAVSATFASYEAQRVSFTLSSRDPVPGQTIAAMRAVPGVVAASRVCELPADEVKTPGVPTGARIHLAHVDRELPTVIDPAHATQLPAEVLAAPAVGGAYVGDSVASQLGLPANGIRELRVAGAIHHSVGVVTSENPGENALSAVNMLGEPPKGTKCVRSAVLVRVTPGAAEVVARRGTKILGGALEQDVSASYLPAPARLANQVETRMMLVSLGVAGLTLLLGMVSIANTMTIAIIQRTPEIGIRRAIGFSPRYIAAFFAGQSALLGLAGGLLGGAVGTVATYIFEAVSGLPLAVDPWVTLATPWVGLVVGLIGGLFPSWRASRIQLAQAVRA